NNLMQLVSDSLVECQNLTFVENLFPLASARAVVPTQILAVLSCKADAFENAEQGKKQNCLHSFFFWFRRPEKSPQRVNRLSRISAACDSQLVYGVWSFTLLPRTLVSPIRKSLDIRVLQIPINELLRCDDSPAKRQQFDSFGFHAESTRCG